MGIGGGELGTLGGGAVGREGGGPRNSKKREKQMIPLYNIYLEVWVEEVEVQNLLVVLVEIVLVKLQPLLHHYHPRIGNERRLVIGKERKQYFRTS